MKSFRLLGAQQCIPNHKLAEYFIWNTCQLNFQNTRKLRRSLMKPLPYRMPLPLHQPFDVHLIGSPRLLRSSFKSINSMNSAVWWILLWCNHHQLLVEVSQEVLIHFLEEIGFESKISTSVHGWSKLTRITQSVVKSFVLRSVIENCHLFRLTKLFKNQCISYTIVKVYTIQIVLEPPTT